MQNVSPKIINPEYNHRTLINNPPYISNYPLLDYIESKKVNSNPQARDMLLLTMKNQKKEENYVDGFWVATFATVGVTAVYARNKVKKVFRRVKSFLK